MSTKKESNAMFWGVVLGAIGGAAFTLLRTPRSGRELRGGITSQASRLTSRGHQATGQAWQSTYQATSDRVDKETSRQGTAEQVWQTASQTASSVQEQASSAVDSAQQQASDVADAAEDVAGSVADDLTSN